MQYPVSPKVGPSRFRRLRLFSPILAGATLRERLIACFGALLGIGLTGVISGYLFGQGPHLPLIVAPMGASAVLLFAVPASPLAQPWAIIGGNTISALMGIIAAYFIRDPIIATGIGVSLAIGAMSFTRCLHPPGGAAALTAVLGGPVVAGWGFLFPFVPVALNSCILVGLGLLFHKLSRRNYPHVVRKPAENTHQTIDPPSAARVGFREEDVDAALEALDETFDIDRADLGRLLQQVELQATIRSNGKISCADIMSRDVIAIGETSGPDAARHLLLKHNIRTLPVRDPEGRLIGTVGLRELFACGDTIAHAISKPAVARASDAALSLLPVLTDGRTHAVIIVDDDHRILGLISQTDLLSAVARLLPNDGGKIAAVA
ncbi:MULTISPECIES: HPP family protein [Rhizobium]|uniref:HPP family protein n=1 Tax=Rhizobium bangladeshense TaxID=1138189 RepID=A0ABS7LLU8_9HYPH|nr:MULTISPECIES: HPP family protein [Rhizobium]MBX4867536.1 HPP family protein [Rhizobium bangladeshense]MBX4871829.1 HPP family protein [Rhizobium bangladeshense]MBX4883143.1 HPP family protein [Rhizobium bangladeshense]MBX4892276.1 HPP family protein [Rhizobium bangladeshense]MBX4897943.1 HPP family protein [Rhizobium bangladeshense]